MNRITRKFEELKKAGRTGFVGYLTAGDPNLEDSEKNIRTAIENGVDILELGMPFSDPTADGPTIQEAAQRALAAGMSVGKTLELLGRLRADYDIPIVLFGYANPMFYYGYERFCSDASGAGADGLLIVDMPVEETGEIRSYADKSGLMLISLIAPTTPPDRIRTVLRDARGFVYYIMFRGVTGARREVAEDIGDHVRVLREATDLPIAAGFGISDGEQARSVASFADAVVIGSALVKAAQRGNLGDLVKDIAGALNAEGR